MLHGRIMESQPPHSNIPHLFIQLLCPGKQGCGIKGFILTSVIQGNSHFYEQISLWEALSVVSQKWIPFPTALREVFGILRESHVSFLGELSIEATTELPSPLYVMCGTCGTKRAGAKERRHMCVCVCVCTERTHI